MRQIQISAQGGGTVARFESPPVSIGSCCATSLCALTVAGAGPMPPSGAVPASDFVQGLITLDVVVTNNSGRSAGPLARYKPLAPGQNDSAP